MLYALGIKFVDSFCLNVTGSNRIRWSKGRTGKLYLNMLAFVYKNKYFNF